MQESNLQLSWPAFSAGGLQIELEEGRGEAEERTCARESGLSRRPHRRAGAQRRARGLLKRGLAASSMLPFALMALALLGCDGEWCPPESRCGNRCVDLETDSEHCGACYVRCIHPSECVDGVCEAPCPPTHHDGGDGACVPRGTCSPGYHDGGDGVCVPAGECRPGYRDGGDGTCYPRGACADGHHDGGDGSCVPIGSCADGFELTRTGHCMPSGSCRGGLAGSEGISSFGRATPGEERLKLLALEPAVSSEQCLLRQLHFAEGSASAFRIVTAPLLPAMIESGSPTQVLLAYEPTSHGAHHGQLVGLLDDPHAPAWRVQLDAEATASQVTTPEHLIEVDGIEIGSFAHVWACVDNHGHEAVILGGVRVGARIYSGVVLDRVPASGSPIAPGERVCVRVEIRPLREGIYAGEVLFDIEDGGLPVVVLVLGESP